MVKTILLVCSSGMSTSMLVSKMKKEAESKGLEYDIYAVSASQADAELDQKRIDVLLLGPQVRYMKSKFEDKCNKNNIAIDVINMQDYGMMNGAKVLNDAISLMNNA